MVDYMKVEAGDCFALWDARVFKLGNELRGLRVDDSSSDALRDERMDAVNATDHASD